MLHGERVVAGASARPRGRARRRRPSLPRRARHRASRRADEYEERAARPRARSSPIRRAPRRDRAQLQQAAAREGGGSADAERLLDEVTALVEKPSVYTRAGSTPAFLAVPQECLILTMRQNQKYFPLFDAAGQAAADVPDRDQHARRRSAPHRRRQRARGAAAPGGRAFFYDQDRKTRARVARAASSRASSTTTSSAPSSSASSAMQLLSGQDRARL